MKYLSIAVLLLLFVAGASAQTDSFSDDFDDGNIDGWTVFDLIGDIIGGPFGEISFPDGGVRLKVDATPNPAFGPGRLGIGYEPLQVTDFAASVDIVDWANTEASPNNLAILAARIREPGPGTSDGYLLSLNNVSPATSEVAFGINRADDEIVLNLVNELVTLDPTHDFRFEFSGNGDQLTGRLIDLADMTTLSTITTNDATYPSCIFGLLAAAGAMEPMGPPNFEAGGDVTFDNFSGSGTLVPEPSAFGLIVIGLIGIIANRRRRRTSRTER